MTLLEFNIAIPILIVSLGIFFGGLTNIFIGLWDDNLRRNNLIMTYVSLTIFLITIIIVALTF